MLMEACIEHAAPLPLSHCKLPVPAAAQSAQRCLPSLQGTARFKVWTYPNVAITTHDALIPDYAKDFERPGYSRVLPMAKKQPGDKAKAARGSGARSGGGAAPNGDDE